MIIQAAVTQNNFLKKIKNNHLQYLNKPTGQTNEAIALKFFPEVH